MYIIGGRKVIHKNENGYFETDGAYCGGARNGSNAAVGGGIGGECGF